MNSWTGGTELCEASQTAVLERDKVGTVWGLAYAEHQRPALCPEPDAPLWACVGE
jgi:hypothetical protein